ncbi:ABC-type dipeptide/oligopeptide/nickel transport system ATPase component [Leucobacter luti]|uniref:dipeptide/oligopeptide/nickel ABC transporter permease/ATP-binding protein n=1 Tax=Leucobacter luti TaxID=340320 RepID=UPI00104EF49D|nr:dipeptide/oligopeptide/nickel ABC transporter permease/ATP-binding protein [Leucobacter luti]MCW2288285.1 ABC-type dipeptide/oligopeptide/nickel transport system ATPase component/ABC-type dipeptide/oligopeptide/nickel transport system permease subunit [Leucobacter luti]TCK45557.1 ABC-type dipeptide/oligopeptide/nickel transport system ATPase component [Leucobacter luti]
MTTPLTDTIDTRGGRRGSLLARLVRRPAGAIALGVLALIVLVGVFAPWLSPYDPNLVDLSITRALPSAEHWLGGDTTGRDVASRLIWGTQITLWGALVAILTALVIGVPAGLAAGYYGGATDRIATWISDGLQSIPGMVILLIVGANTGNNFNILMVTVGIFMAPGYFRLTRSTVLSVRGEAYVDAARVAGLSDVRIMGRHIITQVTAPIVIQSALTAGMAMGMQAGLQFLGIGGGTTPGWGASMNEGFRVMRTDPMLLLWPSLALGITIAALAILGSTLADVISVKTPTLSPRARKKIAAQNAEKRPAGATTTTTGSISVAAVDSAIRLENLRVNYETPEGPVEVVHGITLDVAPGEVLGIVGESGSGKSQTVFSVLDLLPKSGYYTADAIWISGEDVTMLSKRDRSQLLGHEIGYIPQEPMTNLDPSYTIGYQLTEPLRAVHGMTRPEARERALAVLARVGIVDPERVLRSYPHELSGGMAQRVLIAGAIAGKPSVLVADEPTTALDVTVQAEVLELLRELQQEYQMALVIVTHNFGVVADICDRVVVMRSGSIVEIDDVGPIFAHAEHPYTRQLIAASLDGAASRAELDAHTATTQEAPR